jgi:hypothetical protein
MQAVLYLRSRIVKEHLDRVTLAGELGSDIFSSGVDQHYIVMGSIGHDDTDEGLVIQNGKGGDQAVKQAGVMA